MNITVKVKDYGTFNEVFNVTVYANTTAVETREISLTSGASTTLTFTWSATGFAKGNYTLWAYARPVSGETETADNMLIDGWAVVAIVGDINIDGEVDMKDIIPAARAFGSNTGEPRYDPNLDINNDGKIDMKDIISIARNFGKIDP